MSSRASPPQEMPTSPTPKRRKIPLACSACRTRKARCDGNLPSCSSCLKRKPPRQCVYEESTLKTQKHIKSLESRLAELENSKLLGSESPRDVFLVKDLAASRDMVALPSRQDDEERKILKSSPIDEPSVDDTDCPLVDDVRFIEDNEQLFGKTSTTAFMRSLKDTILQSDPADANLSSQDILKDINAIIRCGQRSVKSRHATNMSSFFLPIRIQADRYLECFWQYVHPVYPILHKPTFIASYQSIWISEPSTNGPTAAEDPIFLSTLSMVFALASQVTPTMDPIHKSSLTERFYQQARDQFSIEDLDLVSLPTVQMLLLMGVYLHLTHYTNRCWNVVGLAIRNAQSLGLHEEMRNNSQRQISREMRRRIWYNCILLDSLVSMTFGRPQMISLPTKIPLPLPIDDEYLLSTGEGRQPANKISYLGLFLSSIRLFEIMSEVVSMCNNQKEEANPPNPQADSEWWCSHPLNDILKLDKAMDDFRDQLPNNLRMEHVIHHEIQNTGNSQWIQAKILHCRFLYIRALLLRPLLLSAAQNRKVTNFEVRNPTEIQLGKNIALQICLNCVETVHKLIESIYNSLDVTYQSAGWVVRYAFSGALVLLAARMCAFPEHQCSVVSLQSSWSRCIVIFERYKGHIPSASQAVKLLEVLHHRVSSNLNSAKGLEPNNPNMAEMDDANRNFSQSFALDWPDSFLNDLTDFDVLNMNMSSFFDGDQSMNYNKQL